MSNTLNTSHAITQNCVVIIMTKINSGIDRMPTIIDQLNKPHDNPVAKPCMRIVDATNMMKYPEHNKYAKIGRSPCASKIHDTSHENAPK